MTQHPSLRVSSVGRRHRNVLKRYERIQKLQETGAWHGRESVYGLPKVKSMKIKVKKGKSEKAEEGAQAQPQAAAPAQAQAAKPTQEKQKEKGK